MLSKKRNPGSSGKIKIFILMLILCAAAANAEIITTAFEGVVDYVVDEGVFENNITVGTEISGYYTYTTDSIDSDPHPDSAEYKYNTSPSMFSAEVGGLIFSTNPSDIDINLTLNDDKLSGYEYIDYYMFESLNNAQLANGSEVGIIRWQLYDETHAALSDLLIPLDPPVLDNWLFNSFDVYAGDRLDNFFNGHITSVTLVPEPSTILLFVFGGSFIRRFRK